MVHFSVVSLFSKKKKRREVREKRVRNYERSNEIVKGNSRKDILVIFYRLLGKLPCGPNMVLGQEFQSEWLGG